MKCDDDVTAAISERPCSEYDRCRAGLGEHGGLSGEEFMRTSDADAAAAETADTPPVAPSTPLP